MPQLTSLFRGVLCAGLLCAGSVGAEEVTVTSRFLYETVDGIYVESGSDEGIVVGDEGWFEVGGGEPIRVRVAGVTKTTTFLQVLSGRSAKRNQSFRLGGAVVLRFERAEPTEGEIGGEVEVPVEDERVEDEDVEGLHLFYEPRPDLDLGDLPLRVNAPVR